jgi:hypothetical protein
MFHVPRPRAGPIALGAALLAVGLGAQPAAAQVVNFQGVTEACFYQTGDPMCATTPGATFQGLTFSPGAFNVTTDPTGFVAIGGMGNNLGLMGLTWPPTFDYGSTNFILRTIFTAPTVGGDAIFAAVLRGFVVEDENGVGFTFTDNSQTLTFVDDQGREGEFVIRVNNFGVNANATTQAISGEIEVTAVVPEPATMALLGTGLVGLVGARRRRKNADVA